MLRYARFAFLIGLGATISTVVALDPPPQQNKQNKQDEKKKVEPAKHQPAPDDRIDRRNVRMKERDREIDRRLNQEKK